MKVEIPTKRGASRGKKRGDNRSKMQTDLTVTVANEKDSSTEKGLVATTGQSSRTIVRLNTKTESTGLEKVTVKSLDEIKRDKERRLQGSAASQKSATSKSLSGVTDSEKEWNGAGQPRQTPTSPLVRLQKTNTSAVATCADSTSSSSSADNPSLTSTKIALKELTIPLSALPPRSSIKSKTSQDLCKSRTATLSRPTESVNSSLDSNLSSQDFCSLDDDEHNVDEDLDEDFLLQDNEGSRKSDCREQGIGFVDYSGVPLGLRYNEEEEDETISIYADDSMFEEEDEYFVSNDRLYPRSFGRKSTDDCKKDLRALLSDRQQNRKIEGHTSDLLEKDCHLEEDEKVEAFKSDGEKAEGRDKSVHDQNVTKNRKEPVSTRSNYFGQKSGRTLSKQHIEDRWHCRGSNKQGSRWGGRRQFSSVREGRGPWRGRPPSFHGGGILPLPDPGSGMFLTPALSNIEALKAALEAGIQNNLKKTMEILTNPPPVHGEMVEFLKPESLPVRKCGFKGSGKRLDECRPARHSPTKSRYSNVSGNNRPAAVSNYTKQDRWKNTDTVSRDRGQLVSQQLGTKEVAIPEWLKRSYQVKNVQQEINVAKDSDKHLQPDNVKADSNDLCVGELGRDQGLNLPINDVNKSFEMQTSTGADEMLPLEHNDLPTVNANFQVENEDAAQGKQQLPTTSDAQGDDVPHVLRYPPVQWVENVNGVEVDTPINITQDGPVQQSPAFETLIEMQWPQGKRKSPFQDEPSDHVDKFQLASSPEGRPQPLPSPVREPPNFPYGVCWIQIKRGECRSGNTCKYQHLSASELNQFREVHKLTRDLRQDNAPIEQVPQVPQVPQMSQMPQVPQVPQVPQMPQVPQVPQIQQPDYQSVPLQQEVTKVEENVKAPPVSFESVIQHLNSKNLGAAWQLIERLYRMNNTVGLPVLERTLVLCSEHFEDPDTVAQVACKAFDMIGRVRVRHNRHDYTTLIKTLCNSGQYIRAYEMLEVMKKNGFAPTYDMFLNLVQASEKDPNWAFDLLDDIKAAGLFMSDICSDLILLGCRSGEHFVQKTWLLFQEAQQNQVKLKPEAVSSMLLTLAQSNKWEESVVVTRAFPDAVPVEFIKASMLSGYRNVDWDEAILGLLSMIPAQKLAELDSEVWNTFLCNYCLGQSDDLSFPQRIYSVMKQCSVPLNTQCASEFMSALCNAGQWSAALELFTNMCTDTQVIEQAQALQKGLLSLTSALSRAGEANTMLTVVHFMLEHHIKPSESVLRSSVENLDNESNFLGVHQFFSQLQAAKIVPPLAVYRQIVSSLEKWAENPSASTEAYTALRQAYPVLQQESSIQKAVSKESSKQEQDHPRRTVCRYFGSSRGCFLGDKCLFLHPASRVSVPEESNSISGGSISGESTTGSLGGRKPSQPFLLQNQDAQPRGMLPAKQSGQPFNENWISQSAPETSPFVLQNMRGGTMPFSQAVKPEVSQNPSYGGSEVYNAESSSALPYGRKPHNQAQVCKFYSTLQGCRHGNNCRFVHSQRDFSLPCSTPQVLVVNPPEENTGTKSYNNQANPFVFKEALSTSNKGLAAGGVQNTQHQPARPASQNKLGMEPKIQFSTVFRRFPQPPTFREQHFQLAGVGNFQGRNPFSPILPERTRSLDGLQDSTNASASHQAHSAPVVSERLETSFFQYPSKKNSQFYLPRIKHSSQENKWDDVADVYISMKQEDVEIDDVALQAFYEAFVSNCPQTVGGCFEKFVNKVHNFIDKNNEPDQSPGASFDDEDKSLIGQLGVAFMYFCHSGQNFVQGYTILHTLHNYSVNYTLYNGGFGVHQRPLTATEVTLTAADMCLKLNQPLYNSALEVLRGTNYALPATGMSLDAEEATWRSNVFQALCRNFMKEKTFDLIDELLANIGDAERFGGTELKALYNEYLMALVQSCQLNKAMELLTFMEKELISRDPEAMRALINGLGSAGLITQAKTYFCRGYLSDVYPTFSRESPWTVSIKTSYSALECQFYIEKHLQMLYEFLEEQVLATGHQGFIDSYCRSLRVIVSSDEAPRLYTGYMGSDEIIRCVRDMVVTVLNNDFNPPLACDDLAKDEEVIVNALSLKRWFRANPASGRFKGGSLSAERVTSIDSRNANQHPYLQPGMSNIIVSSVGQESEGRRVSVLMNTDTLSSRQTNSEAEQPLSWKDGRDKVAHIICGRLTIYLRQGKIDSKESFRQWARKLTQAYLKIEGISLIQQNYEAGKERIYQFVDEYFKESQ